MVVNGLGHRLDLFEFGLEQRHLAGAIGVVARGAHGGVGVAIREIAVLGREVGGVENHEFRAKAKKDPMGRVADVEMTLGRRRVVLLIAEDRRATVEDRARARRRHGRGPRVSVVGVDGDVIDARRADALTLGWHGHPLHPGRVGRLCTGRGLQRLCHA